MKHSRRWYYVFLVVGLLLALEYVYQQSERCNKLGKVAVRTAFGGYACVTP